jgi:hypothetical protein
MEELEIAHSVKEHTEVVVRPRLVRMRYQQFIFDEDPLYKKFKKSPFYIIIPIYLFLILRV